MSLCSPFGRFEIFIGCIARIAPTAKWRLYRAASIALLWIYAAAAAAHWDGQPKHQFASFGDFKLRSGEVIPNFRMSYVTHGKLSAAKDNAILFMHGFASNHHAFDHMIGPGRPLDTDKYFIICPDALGATQSNYERTTGPSNSGLKMKFPRYTQRDMVDATYRLITQELGISRLLAAAGISMGGRHSVQLAVSYPHFVEGIIPIAGGASSAASATQGRFRTPLTRASITDCRGWNGGDYDENPKHCATNALSVLVKYFYTPEWWQTYADTTEAYTRWRNNMGEIYLDVQEARDLYFMMGTTGSVADGPEFRGDMAKALGSIRAQALYVYSPRDPLYLARDAEADIRAVPNARGVPVNSDAGHQIGSNADPQATKQIGDAIRVFLDELAAKRGELR